MSNDEIADSFNIAHIEFRVISSWLWNPLGSALSEAAAPAPGDRVLDACCGAGSSAIPTARVVGPGGRVDAVDFADALLTVGRAEGAGLPWLRFHHADVTTWSAEHPYDLVQCGYGVFFLPDMDADSARLVSLLRAGGRFAALVWEQGALVAVMEALLEAAREVHPEPLTPPASAANSERLNSEAKLAGWLTSLGLADVRTVPARRRLPLSADQAWDFARGTGLRRVLTAVGEDGQRRVKDGFLGRLADRGVREMDVSSLVGIGRRR